jgi:tetratricopeptide (TPR) repeat protein
LAVGLYSKNNNDPEVLALLDECHKLRPNDLQLIYEWNIAAVLQNVPIEKRQAFFESLKISKASWDEIYLQEINLFNLLGQHEKALTMLLEHVFTPAEGAEAAIVEEYGNILEIMGLKALIAGKVEEGIKDFSAAINSPSNLGSGYHHEVCYSPYLYGQALCYFKLNRNNEAKEALSRISALPIDDVFFSIMPSYLYFRGMAFLGLGQKEEGKKCLETLKQNAETGLMQNEYGLFSLSSSYVSYIQDPKVQRKIHFGLLLALALNGLGEKQKALDALEKVIMLCPTSEKALLTKLRILCDSDLKASFL